VGESWYKARKNVTVHSLHHTICWRGVWIYGIFRSCWDINFKNNRNIQYTCGGNKFLSRLKAL
jgi:hypothetical protein